MSKNIFSKIFICIFVVIFMSGCARNLSNSMYVSDSTTNFTLEGQIVSVRPVTIKDSDRLQDNTAGMATGALVGGVAGSGIGGGSGRAGGLIGGLGGAIGGEALGQKLVGLMLGEEKTEIDKALEGAPSSASSEQIDSPGASALKPVKKLDRAIRGLPSHKRVQARKNIAIAKKSRKFRSGFLGEGDSFFSGLGEIPIEQETIQKGNLNFNQGGFGGQGGVAAVITDNSITQLESKQGIIGSGVPLVDFSHFGQLAYHGHPNN